MSNTTAALESDDGRGRAADRPGEIPAKGWRDIVFRVKDELSKDNIGIVASGVAFYAFLAIFPALAASISIYGLVADPADIQQQLATLSGILPEQAQEILDQQLGSIAAQPQAALSIGLVIGLLTAIWSAMAGVKTLIIALNIVYDEEEKRGFLKLNAVAFALTIGIILFAILALSLIVALPALLGNLGLGENVQLWASILRWPLLALSAMIILAVLYRYGPSRSQPRWQWVSWGAVVATLLWIIGSALFSFYVSNFGNYNETYGAVGAIVILLLWFYITAYIVLLGGELNAEMEHQTARDTTTGESKTLGTRNAYVADTVGKSSEDADEEQPEGTGPNRSGQPKRIGQDMGEPAFGRNSRNEAAASHPTWQTLSPGEFIDHTLRRFKSHQTSDYANLKNMAKQHPLPFTLIGIGCIWLMLSSPVPQQDIPKQNA